LQDVCCAKSAPDVPPYRVSGNFSSARRIQILSTPARTLADPDTGDDAAAALLRIDYENGLALLMELMHRDQFGFLGGWLNIMEERREKRVVELLGRALEVLPSDDPRRGRVTAVLEYLKFGSRVGV
jgi:hypothetical protein